jgi:hypothetical protein
VDFLKDHKGNIIKDHLGNPKIGTYAQVAEAAEQRKQEEKAATTPPITDINDPNHPDYATNQDRLKGLAKRRDNIKSVMEYIKDKPELKRAYDQLRGTYSEDEALRHLYYQMVEDGLSALIPDALKSLISTQVTGTGTSEKIDNYDYAKWSTQTDSSLTGLKAGVESRNINPTNWTKEQQQLIQLQDMQLNTKPTPETFGSKVGVVSPSVSSDVIVQPPRQ